MRRYKLKLKTDHDLGSEAFVRPLIESWCGRVDERLRPEYYGLGEPVRKSIAEDGVEAVIQTWLTKMCPMLRRKSKPRFIADIDWRKEKGLDRRLFPWGCTVWLDPSAGDELALSLFRFLTGHFKPAFGSLTSEEESREKHFITYENKIGTVEKFVGMDVGETIPGVYWVTYFGPWCVAKVGGLLFEKAPAAGVEKLAGGYLVVAYERSKDIGSADGREAEKKIAGHLGSTYFFDKSQVDIEKLKSS